MILDEIAEKTKKRVAENKQKLPQEEVRREAEARLKRERDEGRELFSFASALQKPGMRFICEVKKASPSKGVIAEEFPYLSIAQSYEEAGADCLSVLTEPYYFLGSPSYLSEIKEAVRLPVLRKDFVVDEYMIYEAKAIGADAVLLICALLEPQRLKAYRQLARELGMSALVEAHDAREIEAALQADAGIIGVNNRDLRDFTVDLSNSLNLRRYVPSDRLFVSESGIKTAEDVRRLEEAGTDAVLIGETLMREKDKKKAMDALKRRN